MLQANNVCVAIPCAPKNGVADLSLLRDVTETEDHPVNPETTPRSTAMTDDRIALRALLACAAKQIKGPDTTFLREMIGFAAQRLMERKTEGLCGARHGERSPDRQVQRNSYRERDWQTRAKWVPVVESDLSCLFVTYLLAIISLIRLASVSIANGFVSTCISGSRCPWLSTAFST